MSYPLVQNMNSTNDDLELMLKQAIDNSDIDFRRDSRDRNGSFIFDCLKVRRERIIRESMESPKFNSVDSRKSSLNPNASKDQQTLNLKEELDFATAQFNRQGSDMFRKRSLMFSFDGENQSSGKSGKTSSYNATSKKSSDNSLASNATMDFPNNGTPNFNPTWK